MRGNRNILTQKLQIIKTEARRLKNTKFYALLITLTVLTGTLCLSPAVSSLINSVIIGCTGRIITEKSSIIYKSEIRGVHIADSIFAFPHNWSVIAETLAGYKINFVTVLLMGLPTSGRPDAEWRACIQAFHSRGIEVWISYHVVGEMAVNDAYKIIDYQGNAVDWNDPCNPNFRQEVKAYVESVASTYDIDGIMFDYARYPGTGMPYTQYDKAAFEEWLNETIPDSNWPPNPSDFAPGGSRYNEFMEWRTVPITNLIRDVRSWMLAINPNLKFGLAQWTLFGYSPDYSPTYWRYNIGQDTAYWVAQDYLDMVMPMMYDEPATGEPHSVETDLLANWKYITGGPEGKIPLIAFINTGYTYTGRDPAEVKACIDKAREMGADGWILWRYGGPGVDDDGYHIDIRPYLNLLTMPDTFSIRNIQVSLNATQATVTWKTDLPATSRIEYSTSPLFNATKKLSGNRYYWDIDYVGGTLIEDLNHVTSHSMTLKGLEPAQTYYFRIQSQNEQGTATSKIFTFTVST